MKVVMVSGHFDPFHDGHLDYIEQALKYGDHIICVVSSDKQLLQKKGKVLIPEQSRLRIVNLIFKGLCKGLWFEHQTFLNIWDKETTFVAEALRFLKPDVFCRGGDKTIEDMPPDEHKVCEELGIKIVHAKFKINRHGAGMLNE